MKMHADRFGDIVGDADLKVTEHLDLLAFIRERRWRRIALLP
jgi:hypothetical protein